MIGTLGQQMADSTKNIVAADLSGAIGSGAALPGGGLEGLMSGMTSVSGFLNGIVNVTIGQFPSYNQKNYAFMLYLMQRNIGEYYSRIMNVSDGAYIGGDGSLMPTQTVPSYAHDIDYAGFANNVVANEKGGWDSTRNKNTNLYPDDNGSGQIENVWRLSGDTDDSMKNSILYQTKELFRKNKINTIISRFATSADGSDSDGMKGGISYNGQVRTRFGESHGRNLLRKDVENGSSDGYSVNGYNNPYCRVWTHHHQYDSYEKVMRPVENAESMRKWDNFRFDNEKWGWKGGKQSGWENSVLNKETGFLNIAPSYGGGGKKNIHPKQCMFSLENLAWKGYDPYSFEQALSWEQRGPLGGRIMWFPPYGIKFSETTQTDWNKEVFIGRGEEVFTYKNTRRTGTLSFMLVVDHPSVLDYATWYESDRYSSNMGGSDNAFSGFESSGLGDNDVHRFFAGCDTDTLLNSVKPTPLTDEAVQLEQQAKEAVKPNVGAKPVEEEPQSNPLEISFYAFYPNNYSGVYDMPNVDYEKVIDNGALKEKPCSVNAISYLLAGIGTHMYTSLVGNKLTQTYLGQLDFSSRKPDNAKGYEMKDANGISVENSYIIGNTVSWQKVTDENSAGKQYNPDTKKVWYYRIDGRYEYPKYESDGYVNTYGQRLTLDADYKDSKSFGLNYDIDEVKKHTEFCNKSENVYSLAEIVYALILSEKIKYDETWKSYLATVLDVNNNANENKRIEAVVSMFKGYKLDEVKCVGYSNKQGDISNAHDERNKYLANNRAVTLVNFLKSTSLYMPEKLSVDMDYHAEIGENVGRENVNDINAKLWRSAKCTLVFQSSEKKSIPETNQGSPDDDKYVKYSQTGETTQDEYPVCTDEHGNKWVNTGGDSYVSYDEYINSLSSGGVETNVLKTFDITDDNAVNKYRYDQEYHFFQELKRTDKITYDKLIDTIKYFNPAYHSMTPEGFNARLTFLHQCTRQGDTTTASDASYGKTANNLAFGRPPFCVLRLGDFFNQLIAIESINFQYLQADGTVWDLNNEGAGVQPMLADVNISFSFVGGADIAGPVRRLQNAMSFNYYANTSLYDNRADRPVYSEDVLAMGGDGNGEPQYKDGDYYTHVVQMTNTKTNK